MAEKNVNNTGKEKNKGSSIKGVKTAPVLKVHETFSCSDEKKKKDGT